MPNIDLTGVDPRRWAEARRRVAVLRDWTAKHRHTRKECVDAAGRLGLTPKHFMTLVSAWKKHGDVARLSGLGMRRGAERGRRWMPAETRKAVLGAVDALGPDARFVDVEAEARRRCDEASLPPASSGMIHHLLMQARRRPETRAGTSEVLVGEVGCMLPTLSGTGDVASPTLVVAVLMPETTVLAHRLVPPGGNRTSALRIVLADVLRADMRRPVVVAKRTAGDIPVADGPPRTGLDLRIATRSEILAKPLGGHIATLPIRHRWPNEGGFRAVAEHASISTPLTAADATEAVRIAVEAHNLARETRERSAAA